MGTRLHGYKALSVCTNVVGLCHMGWSGRSIFTLTETLKLEKILVIDLTNHSKDLALTVSSSLLLLLILLFLPQVVLYKLLLSLQIS
jgi:hypothetical protein